MSGLRFGVCFMADPPVSRVVEMTKLAEGYGFEYAWIWDSHVLWQDVYPIFALMAAATSTIRIGPCVTNPATRDPTVTASTLATLNEISGGRMEMGIGRGDSARRVIGQKPVTVESVEESCREIRELAAGNQIDYHGTPVQIKWAQGKLPIWVAAYGPKALRMAGRVADGVVLQIADPYIVEWSRRYLKEGAEQAGRDPAQIQVMSAAPLLISDDIEDAREQVRWFPAMVSNHVVDLVKRYQPRDLPQELTDYIRERDHYDYQYHGRAGSEHLSFVTDEVVDRFCVIGTAEQCRQKLRVLQQAGVDQFNVYTMVREPEAVIRSMGEQILPAFAASRKGQP